MKLRRVERQAEPTELRWIWCTLVLSKGLGWVLSEAGAHCTKEERAVGDARGRRQLAVRVPARVESKGGSVQHILPTRTLRVLFGHNGGHRFVQRSQKEESDTRYEGRWWR